jgi:hypothetical protein
LEAAVAGNPNSYEAHFQVVFCFAPPWSILFLARYLPLICCFPCRWDDCICSTPRQHLLCKSLLLVGCL